MPLKTPSPLAAVARLAKDRQKIPQRIAQVTVGEILFAFSEVVFQRQNSYYFFGTRLAERRLEQLVHQFLLVSRQIAELQPLPLGLRNVVPIQPPRIVEAHQSFRPLLGAERRDKLLGGA